MTGETLGLGAVAGAGLATGAAPYPKVFTTRDNLESFSSDFTIRWTEDGVAHEAELTPELNARLQGPYNRRNPYGAAMAGGPLLSTRDTTRELHESVVDYAFCRPDGLLQELGLADHPEDIELVVEPLPWAPDIRGRLTPEKPQQQGNCAGMEVRHETGDLGVARAPGHQEASWRPFQSNISSATCRGSLPPLRSGEPPGPAARSSARAPWTSTLC